MKIVGVIPARYASTRFPAKALADIGGRSMIRRVYEQASQSSRLARVVVATDDPRIFEHVQAFGGGVVMTSPNHQSGTDRCFEAIQYLDEIYDYVINIQGDEPFIQPSQINRLASVLNGQTELATLVKVIEDQETLFNPNTPKVLLDHRRNVLYFSRQTIPYLRGVASCRLAFQSHVSTNTLGSTPIERTYWLKSPSYPFRPRKALRPWNNSAGSKTATRSMPSSPPTTRTASTRPRIW